MKFIELFAGIGGFRLGLERAGHECVYTSEWLENPRSIYRHHWGGEVDGRDIRTIRGHELPEADLIVGGFPCATFSVAGKRKGFCLNDARGTLCFEMFRLACERGIPYILFENVKGLLNHDDGRTFAVIISALDELGYDAQWECVDSQNFGVPQHRERIFLVANLRGKPRPKVFPLGENTGTNAGENGRKQKSREGLFSDVSPTLDAHYSKGGASRQYVCEQYRRGYFRDYKSDGIPTLTANMGTGGHNVPFVKIKDATKKGYAVAEDGDYIDLSFAGSETRRGRVQKQRSGTLMAHGQNAGVYKGGSIRKLTPIECERLQGLPDDFTRWMIKDDGTKKENSLSDRYERCGRTVTIPVIEAIGRGLHEFF